MTNEVEAYAYLHEYSKSVKEAIWTVDKRHFEIAISHLQKMAVSGGRVFVMGNGGSAAIAEHFSCDHSKGVRKDTWLIPNVISLSSNLPLITAIANDIDFEEIFAKQLEFQNLNEQDVVIVISSKGNSPNIIKAVEYAQQRAAYIIAMVGFSGGIVKEIVGTPDACIHVNAHNYGVVEDAHQIIMHTMAQYLRMRHSEELSGPL